MGSIVSTRYFYRIGIFKELRGNLVWVKLKIVCFIKAIARIRICVDSQEAFGQEQAQAFADGRAAIEAEQAALQAFFGLIDQQRHVLHPFLAMLFGHTVRMGSLPLLRQFDIVPMLKK